MIITSYYRLYVISFFKTTYIIFLTFTIQLVYGNDELKLIKPNTENGYHNLDFICIKQSTLSDWKYILVDNCECFTSTVFSLKDDYCNNYTNNTKSGYTQITNIIKYNEFNSDSLKEALTKSKISDRDSQGMTQVRYNISWFENSKDMITYAEVQVIIEIQLPLWTNLESQCSNIKDEWNKFNDELRRHEEKHREIFEGYYKDIHERIIGKTADEVNNLVLPKWNKTNLLNQPAMIIDQIQNNYHKELEERGLHPIPVDMSTRC